MPSTTRFCVTPRPFPRFFFAVFRYYIEWDGSSELLCCPFGVCGDAGSGKGATRPWATESAETITGSFGDVFHSFVSQDETLYVSSHDFGEYRWWPMVRTRGSMFCTRGAKPAFDCHADIDGVGRHQRHHPVHVSMGRLGARQCFRRCCRSGSVLGDGTLGRPESVVLRMARAHSAHAPQLLWSLDEPVGRHRWP